MSIAAKRIQHDLYELRNHPDSSPIIFADPVDGNVLRVEAAILGPLETPYANGVFLLEVILSDEYPFCPPQSVTFKRATMHPNVDEYGRFMSDLLTPEKWVPSMTMTIILEHIWARLAIPDIDSKQCDSTRADSYRIDKALFETQAREYSVKYAQAT